MTDAALALMLLPVPFYFLLAKELLVDRGDSLHEMLIKRSCFGATPGTKREKD
jgi:hypothetical protein